MYTILFLFTVTPSWLALSREQRNAIREHEVASVLEQYAGRVSTRFFDAEAFSAACSDFAIFETGDLQDFYFLFEELRDTSLFSRPYLTVNNIIVGLADGFQKFETRKVGAGSQAPSTTRIIPR